MTVAFICTDPPCLGVQSGPVLLRHLVRLGQKHRTICCHYNAAPTPLPYATEKIPLRRWWFIPTFGLAPLRWLNTLCKALYLRKRLGLKRGDAVLVCVHTAEHHLARILARISRARLIAIVHDHWADDADVRPTFAAAHQVLCVSDALTTAARTLGASTARILPPICEPFLGDNLPLPHTPATPCIGIAGSLSTDYLNTAVRFGTDVLAIGAPPTSDHDTPPANLPQTVRHLPRFPENRDALLALRTHCTALLVYQSAANTAYAHYAFPSKLLDFAQTGLPIIICAPHDSPVGRWARAHHWRLYLENIDDSAALTRIQTWLKTPAILAEERAQVRALALTEFHPDTLHALLENSLADHST